MHPIFHYFDRIYRVCPAARAALNDLLETEHYGKNELIQETGNSCRTVYFISSGIARIFYYKDGEDVTEHFAFAGDIIVRAESIGVFRLWRDLGYAAGALLTGILADAFGIYWAVGAIGFLTLLSAGIIAVRMEHNAR